MGLRPTRRRCDDNRTADRIALAMTLVAEADQRRTGLARYLAHSGLDRNPELLDRLVARAERKARREHHRAQARVDRQ
jgi:hypothetical protein